VLRFTCLQQQPLSVLNMMMPLAVCGLLALAVGLVLTAGAGDRQGPSHKGHPPGESFYVCGSLAAQTALAIDAC
jgi:hypothetical protein